MDNNPTKPTSTLSQTSFYQKDGLGNVETQKIVYERLLENAAAKSVYMIFNSRVSMQKGGVFKYTRQSKKYNLQKGENNLIEDGGNASKKQVVPRPFKISGTTTGDFNYGDVWSSKDHPIIPSMSGKQAIDFFRGDQTNSFEHFIDESIAWMHVKTAKKMDDVIANGYVADYPKGRYSLGGTRYNIITDTELNVSTKDSAITLYQKTQKIIREFREQDHNFSRGMYSTNFKIVMDRKFAESQNIVEAFHLSINNEAPKTYRGMPIVGKLHGIDVVLSDRPIKDEAGKRLLIVCAKVGATKTSIVDFVGVSERRNGETHIFTSKTTFEFGQWVLFPEMVLVFVEEGFDPEKPVYKETGDFVEGDNAIQIDGKEDIYNQIRLNADPSDILFLPSQYVKEGVEPELPTSTLTATPTDETGAGLDDGTVAAVGTLTLNSGTSPILKIINSVPVLVETIAIADGAFNETFLNLPPDTYTVEVEAVVSGSPYTLVTDTAIVNAGVFSETQNKEAKKRSKKEAKEALDRAETSKWFESFNKFKELKDYELLDVKKANIIIANMSKSEAKESTIVKVLLEQKAIKKK